MLLGKLRFGAQLVKVGSCGPTDHQAQRVEMQTKRKTQWSETKELVEYKANEIRRMSWIPCLLLLIIQHLFYRAVLDAESLRVTCFFCGLSYILNLALV